MRAANGLSSTKEKCDAYNMARANFGRSLLAWGDYRNRTNSIGNIPMIHKKTDDKDECTAFHSIAAPYVNRFFHRGMGEIIRLSFAEKYPVSGEFFQTEPRAAVVMKTSDVILLRDMLIEMYPLEEVKNVSPAQDTNAQSIPSNDSGKGGV